MSSQRGHGGHPGTRPPARQLTPQPCGPAALPIPACAPAVMRATASGAHDGYGRTSAAAEGSYLGLRLSVLCPGNPQLQRPCVHIQTVLAGSLGRCHNMTWPSFHFLVWNWTSSLALARVTWGHDEMSLTRPGTRASWKGQVASRTEKEAHTPQASEEPCCPQIPSQGQCLSSPAPGRQLRAFPGRAAPGMCSAAPQGPYCPLTVWTGFPWLRPARTELAAGRVVEALLGPSSLRDLGFQGDGEGL